jgi:hypothetical protein
VSGQFRVAILDEADPYGFLRRLRKDVNRKSSQKQGSGRAEMGKGFAPRNACCGLFPASRSTHGQGPAPQGVADPGCAARSVDWLHAVTASNQGVTTFADWSASRFVRHGAIESPLGACEQRLDVQ